MEKEKLFGRRAFAALLVLSLTGGIVSPGAFAQPANQNTNQGTHSDMQLLCSVPPQARASSAGKESSDYEKKLTIRVTAHGAVPEPPIPAAASKDLAAAEVNAILERLEPLKKGRKTEFNMPADSPLPPKPGKIIVESFPPEHTQISKPRSSGNVQIPLTIERFSPEGEIDSSTSRLAVKFSQPMVPLSSLAETSKTSAAALSPAVSGKWRWLDTRTLIFEPTNNHFPGSTKFTATVPLQVKSLSGNKLLKAKTWSFRTPALKVVTCEPENSTSTLSPIVLLTFDQPVKQQAIIEKVKLLLNIKNKDATWSYPSNFEPIDMDSLKTLDRHLRDSVQRRNKDRWVALKLKNSLPRNTTVTVVLQAGAPSQEGPLTTKQKQEFSFSTYGPLLMQKPFTLPVTYPRENIRISFSNELSKNRFKPSMVHISPPISDAKISVDSNYISITGTRKIGSGYNVTVAGDITDIFGQRLGKSDSIDFTVLHYPHGIYLPRTGLVTITPDMPQDFRVYSVNWPALRVRAWKASPSDWIRFRGSNSTFRQSLEKRQPIFDKRFKPKCGSQLAETIVDLKESFALGQTELLLSVERDGKLDSSQADLVWIQYTNIGLSGVYDKENLAVTARTLNDGAPLKGVSLSFFPASNDANSRAVTDNDGAATVPLPVSVGESSLLVASTEKGTSILPHGYWSEWQRQSLRDQLAWYSFTDRGVYRPGEEVYFKGWVRKATQGPTGDVCSTGGGGKVLNYRVKNYSSTITTGTLTLDPYGGFSSSFKLPPNVNLGETNIDIDYAEPFCTYGNSSHHLNFTVQEFRRPEFHVDVSPEVNPPVVLGSAVRFRQEATYYSGGGLPRADVEWNVKVNRVSHIPAGWSDYHFGRWIEWWWERPAVGSSASCSGGSSGGSSGDASDDASDGSSSNATETGSGDSDESKFVTVRATSDSNGCSAVQIDVDSLGTPTPLLIDAESTVADLNNQSRSGSASVLLHPSNCYIGLKPEHASFTTADPIRFNSVVTSIEGKISASCPENFKLFKVITGKGKTSRVLVEEVNRISAAQPQILSFRISEAGTYVVRAGVKDEHQRSNMTEQTIYVRSDELPSEKEKVVVLVPNKEVYNPGDIAEIAVSSPFANSDGTATIARSGIASQRHFSMKGRNYVLKIPIKDEYVPGLYVNVDVAGSCSSGGKDKFGCITARRSAQIQLQVSKMTRRLQLSVTPKVDILEPGEVTSATVVVKDDKGNPLSNRQVTLAVVDESVLSLSNYKLQDPLDVIYAWRASEINELENYSRIAPVTPVVDRRNATGLLLSDSPNYISFSGYPRAASGSGGGCGGSSGPGAAAGEANAEPRALGFIPEVPAEGQAVDKKIRLRTNFCPLATFKASLVTDAKGVATVVYRLPDNLTQYRLMAVAADQHNRFGMGESSITARLPVMVRPSPPRFLNFADHCLIPLVVHNQSKDQQTVQVVLRGTIDGLENGIGKTATVGAGDRVEFLFPTTADAAGVANFQTAVTASRHADAQDFSLPVYTPATTEAFATYGTLDDDGDMGQPVALPPDSFPQFGGLEVSTCSTALNEITDAVSYLRDYQFSCSEQLSSKIMVFAGLKDVSSAFKLSEVNDMQSSIDGWISEILNRQNQNGGFGLWKTCEEYEWPYLSVYVTHALLRAREKGYAVPAATLANGLSYLQNIKDTLRFDFYDPASRRAIVAYSLYVRKLLKDSQPAAARAILAEVPMAEQSPETLGFLLMVLQGDRNSAEQIRAIRTHLNNRVDETASTASINTDNAYGQSSFRLFYTPARADALLLFALIEDSPNSDIIPKLLKGLLRSRNGGAWSNTQENAFASLAIDRYFHTYEEKSPDFTADIWLGSTSLGQQKFSGRSTDTRQLNVPMQFLAWKAIRETLVIAKKGQGRLYYRLGMRYAPRNLRLSALSAGFDVERTYEAVDNADDVRKDSQGVWHVKIGALVRVKVKMKTSGSRFHVALVDSLPAGFEILNLEIAGTKQVDRSGPATAADTDTASTAAEDRWWTSSNSQWWNHENLRDNRAEAFCSVLWKGDYNYNYVARATTAGTFVAPPAKAEEMYEPETFGRSGSACVIVEK